jgi:hypothetical protein
LGAAAAVNVGRRLPPSSPFPWAYPLLPAGEPHELTTLKLLAALSGSGGSSNGSSSGSGGSGVLWNRYAVNLGANDGKTSVGVFVCLLFGCLRIGRRASMNPRIEIPRHILTFSLNMVESLFICGREGSRG